MSAQAHLCARIGIRISVDAAGNVRVVGAKVCDRREHELRIPRLSEFARERASVENRPRPRTSARAPAQRTACARVRVSRAGADPLCFV